MYLDNQNVFNELDIAVYMTFDNSEHFNINQQKMHAENLLKLNDIQIVIFEKTDITLLCKKNSEQTVHFI